MKLSVFGFGVCRFLVVVCGMVFWCLVLVGLWLACVIRCKFVVWCLLCVVCGLNFDVVCCCMCCVLFRVLTLAFVVCCL